MVITSTTNVHVKYIRSLSATRRERQRERSFVLEGVRLVADALASGAKLRCVLYDPAQVAQTSAGQTLLARLETLPASYPATGRVLKAATDTVSPQGVVAVAAMPQLAPRAGVWLLLDSVQDPGNVGTLLRSAEAAGVGQVLCTRGTADVYNPKVVRSAMGAHFSLPLHTDIEYDMLPLLLRDRRQIYTAQGGAETPYFMVDWQGDVALVIGNEAHGMNAAVWSLSPHAIAIPMVGRAESLNAAVAGSIIMFEALRQRRLAGGDIAGGTQAASTAKHRKGEL
jgi:TrmH family RNA methyltransferase